MERRAFQMPASKTRGKRSHAQETRATADDKLMRHIRALGLDSVEAYRAWCRQHGFSDSVAKGWQDWRQERLAARKSGAVDAARSELLRHLEALGLDSTGDYQAWCRRHGFSDSLHKNPQQ